jgi:hypothetical protein
VSAAETPDAIRALITAGEADAVRLADRLKALAVRRKALLVDGSTRDVLDVEDQTKAAQVDLERVKLRLEGLEERLRVARAAELRAKARAEREETARLIRRKLEVDRKLDQALARLDELAAERRALDAEIRRRWLLHQAEFGPFSADFLRDFTTLRSAVPYGLAQELGVPGGRGAPLAEGDLALNALARLEAGPPPPAPVARQPAQACGPRVIHGGRAGVYDLPPGAA